MKLINGVITALAIVFGTAAHAQQLAVIDSGRLTTGIQHAMTPFKANGMDSAYEQDFMVLGYKFATKERLVLGVGVGLVLNGVVTGEQDQKFSDAEGERFLLQGQYGMAKFGGSHYLYGEMIARRDEFDYHQPDIDLKWTVLHTQAGLLMAHRLGDFTFHEALRLTTYYKGRAVLPIPQLGVLKYKIERPSNVELTLGMGYKLDPSFDVRIDFTGLQGFSGMFALDFKI